MRLVDELKQVFFYDPRPKIEGPKTAGRRSAGSRRATPEGQKARRIERPHIVHFAVLPKRPGCASATGSLSKISQSGTTHKVLRLTAGGGARRHEAPR